MNKRSYGYRHQAVSQVLFNAPHLSVLEGRAIAFLAFFPLTVSLTGPRSRPPLPPSNLPCRVRQSVPLHCPHGPGRRRRRRQVEVRRLE